MSDTRQQYGLPYPAPGGYFNAATGEREPWMRCAYCSTHVLNHDDNQAPHCDCGKTFVMSNGGRGVNLR